MIPFTSVCGHTCYSPPLRARPPFVVDIGANRGEFSFQILQLFGGDGILVEANPNLISHLKSRFTTRKVVHAAVSDKCGFVCFNVSSNDEASSVLKLPESQAYQIHLSETVQVTSLTLDRLLADINKPIDLLKMDIEGAECQALDPPSRFLIDRVSQICIEFHSAPVFGYDLMAQTRKVIDLLTEMGFYAIDWSHGDLTDVLFINTRLNHFFLPKYRLFQLRERASKLKRSLFTRRE